MKVIWESPDIQAGTRVRKPGCIEVWMIGYDPNAFKPGHKWALISLADGAICVSEYAASQLADHLNEAECQPVVLVGEKD